MTTMSMSARLKSNLPKVGCDTIYKRQTLKFRLWQRKQTYAIYKYDNNNNNNNNNNSNNNNKNNKNKNNDNNNIYVTLCSVGKTAECYCMLLYVAVIHCTPVLSRMVPEARSIGGQPQQCINFPLGHNGAAGGVGEKYDGR